MTYMKVLELLIPSVIRELFLTREASCIKLATSLCSPFQLKVLVGWYVLDASKANRYKVPYLYAHDAVPSQAVIDAMSRYVWNVIIEEKTVSSEIREFLKSRKA